MWYVRDMPHMFECTLCRCVIAAVLPIHSSCAPLERLIGAV